MFWLIIIILSYFLFALSSLGDRFLLIGPPDPKVYTFYVGALSGVAFFLVPFVEFSFLSFFQTLLCLLTGGVFCLSLFGLFWGLKRFEASRLVPAIGGFVPLFSYLLINVFGQRRISLGFFEMSSFVLFILGTILITKNKSKITLSSLKISLIVAFLLSVFFVLIKYIYTQVPFWSGFIYTRAGIFFVSILFLCFPEVRKKVLKRQTGFNKKTGIIFVLNQIIGATGSILQNWGVALAGFVYLPIINALQGIQYVFLFVFSILFSRFLKEKISRKIIFQKIIAILLIGTGLLILTLQ